MKIGIRGAAWLLAVVAGAAPAQSGGTLEIRRSTMDGGGGVAGNGTRVLQGTIGQHDAQYSSGGSFALRGGFWGAPAAAEDSLFYDGFE